MSFFGLELEPGAELAMSAHAGDGEHALGSGAAAGAPKGEDAAPLLRPADEEEDSSDESASSSDSSDQSDSESSSGSATGSEAAGEDACAMCSAASKYTCPKCLVRTCSLACCTEHKTLFSCDGKRAKSNFARTRTELTENVLMSDYSFLEDAARFVGQSERASINTQKRKKVQPLRLTKLLRAARDRHVRLRIMPDTFSRRVANTTYFNDKLQAILWRIEFVFARADAKIVLDGVRDSDVIRTQLEALFARSPDNYARRLKLGPYTDAVQGADVSTLKLFLKAEERPANQQGYIPLQPTGTWAAELANLVIVEHPTVYVALPDETTYNIVPRPTAAIFHPGPTDSQPPAPGMHHTFPSSAPPAQASLPLKNPAVAAYVPPPRASAGFLDSEILLDDDQ
eukprot:m.248831 g.248831  ORF g.248831 m.248831 type:complete len:399 (+) comp15848_c0_seq1:35-1231(+)